MFSGNDRSVGSGRGALFGLRDEARLKQARTTGANELKTVCFEFRVDKFRLQGISARLGVLIACLLLVLERHSDAIFCARISE